MIKWLLIIIGGLIAGFFLFIVLTAWVLSEGFKARDEEAMKVIEQQRLKLTSQMNHQHEKDTLP